MAKRASDTRWTNKRLDGTYVTGGGKAKAGWNNYRMQQCPICKRRRRYYRACLVPEAYNIVLAERKTDTMPFIPVTMRTVLGKRFELKKAAWEAHVVECALMARTKAGEAVPEDEIQESIELSAEAPGYFVNYKGERVDTYPDDKGETGCKKTQSDDTPF
jgi:hypothetical protein